MSSIIAHLSRPWLSRGFATAAKPATKTTRRAGKKRREALQEKLSSEVKSRLKRKSDRKVFEAAEEREALGKTMPETNTVTPFVHQLENDDHHLPSVSTPTKTQLQTDSKPSKALAEQSPLNRKLTSQQIRAGAALNATKLDGVSTDGESIDFYNALSFSVTSQLHGKPIKEKPHVEPSRDNQLVVLNNENGENIFASTERPVGLLEESPLPDVFFQAANRPRNAHSYLRLIRVQDAHNMTSHALATFREMVVEHSIQPTLQHFTALIVACGRAIPRPLTETALALFNDALNRKIQPDVVLFGALIHTLGRGQALNQAFGVLRLMAEHNVKPNQIIYTSLIQASVNAKQIQRAWDTFHAMQQNFEQPDVILYNTLLRACIQNKEAEKAITLFDEMRACGIQPQTITFCALIRSLASRKEYYTKAFELFSQMKSMGVRPNDYVLSALLYATAQQNDFDNSLELWRTVETMKVEKTKILYTAMLFCIAKTQTKENIKTREYGDLTQGKRIRMAANLLKELRVQHTLDTCTLNHALSVLTLSNRVHQAFEFYSQMYTEQAPADEHTHMALLRMCNSTRLLQKAEQVFADMRQSNVTPSFEAYTIMLRLFAEFEDREGAQPYLQQMQQLGYELKSRSLKLSIPTFFTMSDQDRYRENIQGEMPFHPDMPQYPTKERSITYPFNSDLKFAQVDTSQAVAAGGFISHPPAVQSLPLATELNAPASPFETPSTPAEPAQPDGKHVGTVTKHDVNEPERELIPIVRVKAEKLKEMAFDARRL